MDIAIIGAGNVGGALARGMSRAGHAVTVTANDLEHARALAEEIGVSAAASTRDTAGAAEVIVIAVPHAATPEVARELNGVVSGRVIVDATNPLGADPARLAVTDRAGAEQLQAALPSAKVVKAFNTVFAANQAYPVVDGVTLDGFYAGDDEQAKRIVRRLLDTMGYHPVDAGPLSAALSLEHLAFLNISLNARHGWAWRNGWKLVGPTP
jgi:8-hydroxy-5-deazaflavin:NADPH oxidoreductase